MSCFILHKRPEGPHLVKPERCQFLESFQRMVTGNHSRNEILETEVFSKTTADCCVKLHPGVLSRAWCIGTVARCERSTVRCLPVSCSSNMPSQYGLHHWSDRRNCGYQCSIPVQVRYIRLFTTCVLSKVKAALEQLLLLDDTTCQGKEKEGV